MLIDKNMNLDRELEYFPDGGLAFAQNIVVSQDGLTIQNEPAIVDFLSKRNFDLVGFIACNEEFVLFSKDNQIIRVDKNAKEIPCETNWHWEGGEVFGTFTYNVANELIVAISERFANKCPLKIINLDRDKKVEGATDSIYSLTPDIPKSNIINFNYTTGNKIRKGKYNFFIKYYINEDYETGWYPIGFPIFAYDNSKADSPKMTAEEYVQAYDKPETGTKNVRVYNLTYDDFYNQDDEYTNDNIRIYLDINDELFYTHYSIGYIINYNGGTEGRQSAKFDIHTKTIIINDNSTPISIDELTVGNFNIYDVNTMCNYKNRLYLANYKEENRNEIIPKIDVSGIKVKYLVDSLDNPQIPLLSVKNKYRDSNYGWSELQIGVHDEFEFDYSSLKNQWKSKPGRAAIYNFYIHYVYPNGNYTDGIKIGSLDDYTNILILGTSPTTVDETNTKVSQKYTFKVDKNTTTNQIIDAIESNNNIVVNENLYKFLKDNVDVVWWAIESQYYSLYPNELNETYPIIKDYQYLNTFINSNGDVLYRTPITARFNADKLIFEGIKMYPEFVGYFISYEEPEYINIGEGFINPYIVDEKIGIDDSVQRDSNGDLFDINTSVSSKEWKFYYPEFNIIGGKTSINRLVSSAFHTKITENYAYTVNSNRLAPTKAKGYIMSKAEFGNSRINENVIKTEIISPNSSENIGKEGVLKVVTEKEFDRTYYEKEVYSYLGINNNFNIYLSKDKKLVSLGYIKYVNFENENKTYTYGEENIPYNYDFYRCYSSIYWFRYGGILIDSVESNPTVVNRMIIDLEAYKNSYNDYGTEMQENNRIAGANYYSEKALPNTRYFPHIGILKYWHETHYPLFLKELNQGPELIFRANFKYGFIENSGTDNVTIDAETVRQTKNLVLSPQYVNDLYKLNPCYYDYSGKLLVNYDKNLISNQMTEYTKTVRRSDVIQSESTINSWRYFRPENYKIITENKGKITNVVGIGNYLFVHCEHSLFVFDITDSLQALDKNVQLLQPDTFEVAYKEVFTADKGFGGLQDFVSWICDEFGYIFFDKSAQKIYRFDSGQLKDISEGINNLNDLIYTQAILFGNDRPRNRILANLRGATDDVILSYNLLSGGWISTHSYISNYHFINLKDEIFIPDVTGNIVNITKFDINEFNNSTLPVGNIASDNSYKSFIDVVFTNPNYNKIKVLDFITYILNKEPNDKFELLQLEIYTNCCYSGVIDIREERKKVIEYNKPYYDYERWNFNYFRNKIDKIENEDIFNRITGKKINLPEKVQRGYDNALISGKYAVIRFIFKNTTKEVNIKDIHAYFKP